MALYRVWQTPLCRIQIFLEAPLLWLAISLHQTLPKIQGTQV